MKRCSISLIIREMQIKTTRSNHLTPVRVVIKKSPTKKCQGLPWWSSGQESACQCRGLGFDSWYRRIPHALGQLSLSATTTYPRHLETISATKEATAKRSSCTATREQTLPTPTIESPCTATKTQHSQKVHKSKKKKKCRRGRRGKGSLAHCG